MMSVRLILALGAITALTACTHTRAPVAEVEYKTITVTRRGQCPDAAVYAKLKASRPTPLRRQDKPRTGVERVARTAAQLGLYEREGGWADQVSATLDRCQIEGEDAEEAKGVASSP